MHLADTYLRLQAFDKAEERLRLVVHLAPGHLDARIDLGETLISSGEKGDLSALDEAAEEFSEVLTIDETMVLQPGDRRGSTRLSPKRRAAVLYARGYSRVQSYESKLLAPFRGRGVLRLALADFREAWRLDPTNYRADRAIKKVEPLVSSRSPAGLPEKLGPLLVVILAILAMVLASANFFLGWPTRLLDSGYWLLAVFGCLIFVIAGLTLPELLKLKVGGIELEKGTSQQTIGAVHLELHKGDLKAVFETTVRLAAMPATPERNVPLSPEALRTRLPAKESADELKGNEIRS